MNSAFFQFMSIATVSAIAFSQSLNVDFSDRAGVPSASYAAEGLAGWWNGYSEDPGTALALNGLAGQATGASVTATGFREYQALGFGGDGDLGSMISDRVVSAGDPVMLNFTGLSNGNYQVWTYVASSSTRELEVAVNGDLATIETITTGWTGALALGQTHSFHMVEVTDGTLSVAVSLGDPFVNGIQLVIPAPSSLAMLGVTTMFTTRRRRS